jgi:hypothetical protein
MGQALANPSVARLSLACRRLSNYTDRIPWRGAECADAHAAHGDRDNEVAADRAVKGETAMDKIRRGDRPCVFISYASADCARALPVMLARVEAPTA